MLAGAFGAKAAQKQAGDGVAAVANGGARDGAAAWEQRNRFGVIAMPSLLANCVCLR